MVCEINLLHVGSGPDNWEAFLADHTPPALDDALKGLSYDALSQTFQDVCRTTPEAIFKAIPMTMPMTHLATVSGKKMDGIAQYPVDAWINANAPCFTSEKWAMICLLIAERAMGPTQAAGFSNEDMEVFKKLFSAASRIKETGVGAHPHC